MGWPYQCRCCHHRCIIIVRLTRSWGEAALSSSVMLLVQASGLPACDCLHGDRRPRLCDRKPRPQVPGAIANNTNCGPNRPDRHVERWVSTAANEPFVGTKALDMALVDSATNIFPWTVDRRFVPRKWWLNHTNDRTLLFDADAGHGTETETTDQENHFAQAVVIIVEFAQQCISRMSMLIKELVRAMGPDTCDLRLKVGSILVRLLVGLSAAIAQNTSLWARPRTRQTSW
jgi:hypothetical protein